MTSRISFFMPASLLRGGCGGSGGAELWCRRTLVAPNSFGAELFWRRWTGIEPAGRGSPVPPALKAGEPTRCPDTSTSDPRRPEPSVNISGTGNGVRGAVQRRGALVFAGVRAQVSRGEGHADGA